MKLSGRVPEASESFRAQPAILHYRVLRAFHPTLSNPPDFGLNRPVEALCDHARKLTIYRTSGRPSRNWKRIG